MREATTRPRAVRPSLTVALAAVGLAVGCGSSGSPRLDTGLSRGRSVTELDNTALQRMCLDAEDVANRLAPRNRAFDAHCSWFGVLLAVENANPDLCRVARRGCLDSPPPELTSEVPVDLDCGDLDTTDVVGCGASVAQIEDCANAQSRVYDEIFAAIDCGLASDAIGRSQVEVLLDSVDQLPECAALHGGCEPVRFFRDLEDILPE